MLRTLRVRIPSFRIEHRWWRYADHRLIAGNPSGSNCMPGRPVERTSRTAKSIAASDRATLDLPVRPPVRLRTVGKSNFLSAKFSIVTARLIRDGDRPASDGALNGSGCGPTFTYFESGINLLEIDALSEGDRLLPPALDRLRSFDRTAWTVCHTAGRRHFRSWGWPATSRSPESNGKSRPAAVRWWTSLSPAAARANSTRGNRWLRDKLPVRRAPSCR